MRHERRARDSRLPRVAQLDRPRGDSPRSRIAARGVGRNRGRRTGADRIAREEAQALGIHVATVRALWDYYDRSAGYRRNEAMARLRPDFVYAYNLGTAGTEQMIRLAEAECIPVRER